MRLSLSHAAAAALALQLIACGDKAEDDDASSGDDPVDADGDGATSDDDCDDDDPAVYPGADELCDGLDNDCDDEVDEDPVDATTFYTDADGDGYGDAALAVFACEAGSGLVNDDTDCDDDDAAVNPAATEVCDASDVDEDCSGDADDADAGLDTATQSTWYTDADTDGYGDAATGRDACDPASGEVADDTDCDDTDPAISPAATEVCDEADVDEDCSGDADDADAGVDTASQSTWYTDADTDGYGDPATARDACDVASGEVADGTDCDDDDAAVNPAATEVCDDDDVDEDCSGDADDADSGVDSSTHTTWYTDADTDGYGDATTARDACDAASGEVSDATDCDDTDASIHPAATEICDAGDVDEDCSGAADDADTGVDTSTHSTWYTDADTDTYGDAATARDACDPSSDEVSDATDCDDTDPAINPAATEICDAGDVDEDCSGAADDADTSVDTSTHSTWYTDADADTYGDAATARGACDAASGEVADDTDCDDTDAAVNPAATEICDASDVDEDCSGAADDADTGVDTSTHSTWYTDADADTYGDAATARGACDAASGEVADDTDCDDTDPAINPVGTEVCDDDDADEDCDGSADDADSSVDPSTYQTWFTDGDGDGYGDSSSTSTTCDPATGEVADDTDCDDTDAAINPGATDTPQDGVDDDCDGADAPYAVSDLLDGDIMITEIMQNPSLVADADGEWFEIWNNSGGEIDLDGLYVYDVGAGGAVNTDFTVAGPLTFGDGEFLVFGRDTDTAINGGAPVDYAFGGSMALANGSDELILTDGGTGGTELDRVEWDDGATFPDPTGDAMSFCWGRTHNDDGDNWVAETTETYGLGDYGTPGEENPGCSAVYGHDTEYPGSSGHGADYLLGQKITVTDAGVLDAFGVIFKSGGANYNMGLYTDSGGVPGTLVAQTGSLSYSGAGRVEPDVTDVALPAGDYWIMVVFSGTAYVGEATSGLQTTYFRSLSFTSTLPSSYGSASSFSYAAFNYYIVVY